MQFGIAIACFLCGAWLIWIGFHDKTLTDVGDIFGHLGKILLGENISGVTP